MVPRSDRAAKRYLQKSDEFVYASARVTPSAVSIEPSVFVCIRESKSDACSTGVVKVFLVSLEPL